MSYTTVNGLFTGIADAIRTMDGTSAAIATQDMPAKIAAIPQLDTSDATAAETDILNPKTAYVADGTMKTGVGRLAEYGGGVFYTPNYVYPYSGQMPTSTFRLAYELLTMDTGDSTGGGNYLFHTCTAMTSVTCPKMLTYSTMAFRECTALQTAILGSIGYPVTLIYSNAFMLCTQIGLTITVYVTPGEQPLASSPWGATNATIVYRSAVDGSVL